MNAIESGLVQFYEPCAGGCGEPVLGGAMCPECAGLAQLYDAAECAARARQIYERERAAPRRGLFTFLGWNSAGPARAARLAAESDTAPVAGDPARRSELMAKLPRVQAGVREMRADVRGLRALSRWELCQCDVSLCTVAAVVVWDALRWAWYSAVDGLARFAARRLRGRLGLTAMLVGVSLGLAASLLAWRMR
jgi:hypothetical protein